MDRMTTSYDSTWEEEEEEEEEEDDDYSQEDCSTNAKQRIFQTREVARQPQHGKLLICRYKYMSSSAAWDMQNYRHGSRRTGTYYQDDPEKMPNLRFYRNEMMFKPNGVYIDDLLKTWKGDNERLERNHSYIQWLFPLQERGVNPYAVPLQKNEIEMMKKDREVRRRLLEAYKLMLGFYGLRLKSEETGEVHRAENWHERYENLNKNTHNNLRITRILKCLGELGFQRYQAPLVRFFLEETLCQGQLKKVKTSVLDYFMFSVKDKRERRDLVCLAWKHYTPQSEFVWGPVDLLRRYQGGLKRKREERECDTNGKETEQEENKEDKKETNEGARTPYESRQEEDRDKQTITNKRNGQDGMKEHNNAEKSCNNVPQRNNNNNEDAVKVYKLKDGEEENTQGGEMEHVKEETPYNIQPQREHNGDDETKPGEKNCQDGKKKDCKGETPDDRSQSIDNGDGNMKKHGIPNNINDTDELSSNVKVVTEEEQKCGVRFCGVLSCWRKPK